MTATAHAAAASEDEFRSLLSQLKPTELIDLAGILQRATLSHQVAGDTLPGTLNRISRGKLKQACA